MTPKSPIAESDPKRELGPRIATADEEGRVDEVELLFDGERPEVEQREGRRVRSR